MALPPAELVDNVPSERTKLSPLLDNGVEEAQAEEKVAPGRLLFTHISNIADARRIRAIVRELVGVLWQL